MSNKSKIPTELNFLAPIILDDLIRIGGANDGGYIVPKSVLEKTEFLLSLGVGENWSFDKDFLSINQNLKIHAYDHTVSQKKFIKNIAHSVISLLFVKSTLTEVFDKVKLFLSYKNFFSKSAKHFQERINHRKETNYDATVQMVFDRIDSNNIFVKMDIEGSEYLVIDDLLKHTPNIIGLAIEFHNTEPLRLIFADAIKKIQCHYEIIHLHANNYGHVGMDGLPETLELTFVKKEFCTGKERRSALPIDLDEPNNPSKEDYRIIFN